MNLHTHCPRCQSDLGTDAYATGTAICKCGWFATNGADAEQRKTEKRTIAFMAMAAVLLGVGYAHLLSWGSYAVAIPFVKIQQVTGTLSAEGYQGLVDACVSLNKWSCAENALIGKFKKGDLEALAQLGSLESRIDKRAEAMQFYAAYVAKGGKDNRALINYGTLLEESGQIDQAFQVFETAIASNPELLPVQATTAIVRMLIKQGKETEARARIVAFHKSAGNAKGYLNTELTQLQNKGKSGRSI